MRAANPERGRASTSAVGPCSTTSPSASTTSRSARTTASRTSWVTTRTVWPTVAHDAAQHGPHGGRRVDVEGGEGFVEQQQVGLDGQRAGDRHPLGLPAGELGRPAVGELGDAHLGEPAVGDRPRGPSTLPRAARPERDVLARGQVREEQRLLAEQPDPPPVDGHGDAGRGVGEDPVGQGHGRRLGVEQAGQRPEQRRLARPVGPEDRDDLAGRDLDGDVEGEAAAAGGDAGGEARGVRAKGTISRSIRLTVPFARLRPGSRRAHRTPLASRVRVATMTTTATTTSSRESATAESRSSWESR